VKPNQHDDNGWETRVPNVDVRVVVFTVSDGRLWVALEDRGNHRCLPRGIPSRDESLDATATRILANQMAIPERYLEQLYSLSQVTDGEWTVSVTYLGLTIAGTAERPRNSTVWFEAEALPEPNHVDLNIIQYGLVRLRAKLGYTTIAFHLLPPCFSLSELQHVYEAVLGRELDKRNFRRRIHAAGILEATGDARREGSHRPARLYRFRAAHDADTYLTPAWAANNERETTAT
jgi:8-oxo-dGTP diphosphatase